VTGIESYYCYRFPHISDASRFALGGYMWIHQQEGPALATSQGVIALREAGR
jgi:hypothetical protein